jgi:hypothetical protein
MKILGVLTVICLVVPIVANAQARKADPPTKTLCGMSITTLTHIEYLADTMDTENKSPDDQIEGVYQNWEQHFSEAGTCLGGAQTSEDRVYALSQLAALWAFRAKYDEIHEAAELKNLNTQIANLQKIVNRPYINEPRPIHMTCTPTGGCNGEILIPNARSSGTPFHMTCRSGIGQAECDGDLMP